MKLIDSLKQSDGPGGTLVTGLLKNELLIGFCKDEVYYHLFIENKNSNLFTKCIFDKLNHPYNEIKMEYGSFFPPKIKMKHKYFDKFVELVENISPKDLTSDPFSG